MIGWNNMNLKYPRHVHERFAMRIESELLSRLEHSAELVHFSADDIVSGHARPRLVGAG
jgi:hypothetical protein